MNKMFKSFHLELDYQQQKLKNKLKAEKQREAYRKDPTLAPNLFDDVIDQNLELMLNDSELARDVAAGIENKAELDFVKESADNLLQGLKAKAKQQAEKELAALSFKK